MQTFQTQHAPLLPAERQSVQRIVHGLPRCEPARKGHAPDRAPQSRQDASLSAQIVAVAGGDVAALRNLYAETSARLLGLCLNVVKNRPAAEDVLQEVYIKIWNCAAGFDPDRGSAWPWLMRIAHNASVDSLRARARRNRLDGEKYLIMREADEEMPADQRITEAEEGARALAAMEKLDAAALQCMRPAFVEGLTYSQVAEREGLPLGTVKSRIRRALAQLRDQLADG